MISSLTYCPIATKIMKYMKNHRIKRYHSWTFFRFLLRFPFIVDDPLPFGGVLYSLQPPNILRRYKHYLSTPFRNFFLFNLFFFHRYTTILEHGIKSNSKLFDIVCVCWWRCVMNSRNIVKIKRKLTLLCKYIGNYITYYFWSIKFTCH